jgi:mannose-6-phosphate isomerase-like protein (cupin superfamily)
MYGRLMGQTGDTYGLPDGSRYILRTPTSETDGEFVEFEFDFPQDVAAPPPHIHPNQSESYEVIEGELEVMVDGEWQTLREGESATVPAGVSHTFRTPGGPARARNFHRPALGFEPFIEAMHRVCREKNLRRPRDPRIPIYLARVWHEFPETLQATRRRDRLSLRAAAAIARFLP